MFLSKKSREERKLKKEERREQKARNEEKLYQLCTIVEAEWVAQNNKLIEEATAMSLQRNELKIMSVMWNGNAPMTKEEILKALSLYPAFPVHYVEWDNTRVSTQIKSLLEKKAIAVAPNCAEDGEEAYVPVYSREEYIFFNFKHYNGTMPRARYSHGDTMSATHKFFGKWGNEG